MSKEGFIIHEKLLDKEEFMVNWKILEYAQVRFGYVLYLYIDLYIENALIPDIYLSEYFYNCLALGFMVNGSYFDLVAI